MFFFKKKRLKFFWKCFFHRSLFSIKTKIFDGHKRLKKFFFIFIPVVFVKTHTWFFTMDWLNTVFFLLISEPEARWKSVRLLSMTVLYSNKLKIFTDFTNKIELVFWLVLFVEIMLLTVLLTSQSWQCARLLVKIQPDSIFFCLFFSPKGKKFFFGNIFHRNKKCMAVVNCSTKSDTFSICACHPCAGAMLIFSVSFQFLRMTPKGSKETIRHLLYNELTTVQFLFRWKKVFFLDNRIIFISVNGKYFEGGRFPFGEKKIQNRVGC